MPRFLNSDFKLNFTAKSLAAIAAKIEKQTIFVKKESKLKLEFRAAAEKDFYFPFNCLFQMI